jgi:hypothetical protein
MTIEQIANENAAERLHAIPLHPQTGPHGASPTTTSHQLRREVEDLTVLVLHVAEVSFRCLLVATRPWTIRIRRT